MRSARRFLLACVVACSSCAHGTAQEEAPAVDAQAIDRVVERGTAALLLLQRPDGGFADEAGITALAGIALLAGGHVPDRGDHHAESAATLACVIAAIDPLSGHVPGAGNYLYSHGFAAQYLADCHGMTTDPRLGPALRQVVEYLDQAQGPSGGWRHHPDSGSADLSVTVRSVPRTTPAPTADPAKRPWSARWHTSAAAPTPTAPSPTSPAQKVRSACAAFRAPQRQ